MNTARKKEMADLLQKVAVLLKKAAVRPQASPAPKFAIDLRAVRELIRSQPGHANG